MTWSIAAALGLGASELFKYNRENYKFDKDQMLERELMRIEMQVKRFELFREDIRDLVELTVGRMDVYHLVGALFLEFCVVFFCEGRVQGSAPPFLLSLFLLSNACSFVYLLLAVWLSMHASVASHSFGVRILTRFVRLPIPSPGQIKNLNSNLAGFEFQKASDMFRLPFIQAPDQEWQQKKAAGNTTQTEHLTGSAPGALEERGAAIAAGNAQGPPEHRTPAALPQVPLPVVAAARQDHTPAAAAGADGQEPEDGRLPEDDGRVNAQAEPSELLGDGERPFDDEHLLLRGASMPERHVQLFRRLQAKWQCYDAYCRVCMTLGVNQILQGLTYFSICHTLVENRSPSCGYALMMIFQAVALALARLDISGLHRWQVVAVQSVGTLPAFLAAAAVHAAERSEEGALEPHEDYPSSPYMFFLQACWLELLLWVAAPSKDDAALPRRFRSVLFLDVFGDAEDPFEAEHRPNQVNLTPVNDHGGRAALRQLAAERVTAAEDALAIAQAALRRWSAVPQPSLTQQQAQELSHARNELTVWRRALAGEIAWRAAVDGLPHLGSAREEDDGGGPVQPWGELTPRERDEDPFAYSLAGPLEHDTGYDVTTFYYDVERATYAWEINSQDRVLTTREVTMYVRTLEASTRLLLGTADTIERDEQEGAQAAADPILEAGATASTQAPRSAGRGLRSLFAAGLHAVLRIPLSEARGIELAEHLDRPLLRENSGGAVQGRRGVRGRGLDRIHLAAAGPHAQHFVPERLPWQLVRGVTRVLQLCWVFVGMMAVLRELGLWRIDFQQHHGHDRRLAAAASSTTGALASQLARCTPPKEEVLRFDSIKILWPHRLFFRPTRLFCNHAPLAPLHLPARSPGSAASGLLVGSPFKLYEARRTESGEMHLETLPQSVFPIASAAFCAASRRGCLLGALTKQGLAVWPSGKAESEAESLLISFPGQQWQVVAGAVLDCSRTERMIGTDTHDFQRSENQSIPDKWCLVLVGWNGERLPVVVLPLPGKPDDLPGAPGSSMQVVPAFDVPLRPPRSSHTQCSASAARPSGPTCDRGFGQVEVGAGTAVVALHVEAESGRLWALRADGELQAWSLLPPKFLGIWQPRWPASAQSASTFEAAALCEDAQGGLLVAGRNEDVGAELLRAELPANFEV